MKLVRDKIPEIIYVNGEIACVHIADDDEYSSLLRQKLQEEVDEYVESGAPEELADILEVLYALAALLGMSETNLEHLRRTKADARGGFLRRIVWHGSRPRLAPTSSAATALSVEPPVDRPTRPIEPTDDVPLFDLGQFTRPINRPRDGARRRGRSSQSTTVRDAGEFSNDGKQLQLALEVLGG
jgi:predicted house-cleaning noncanonical NTP pyrophosphatase (MazG superfamily)